MSDKSDNQSQQSEKINSIISEFLETERNQIELLRKKDHLAIDAKYDAMLLQLDSMSKVASGCFNQYDESMCSKVRSQFLENARRVKFEVVPDHTIRQKTKPFCSPFARHFKNVKAFEFVTSYTKIDRYNVKSKIEYFTFVTVKVRTISQDICEVINLCTFKFINGDECRLFDSENYIIKNNILVIYDNTSDDEMEIRTYDDCFKVNTTSSLDLETSLYAYVKN